LLIGPIYSRHYVLTDLVGALIQVTRAEGDPSSNNPESVRLDEILGEVVEDCRVEAEARGCRIALGGAPELNMRGDRELLRRAIENVLRNSIRYAPGGSAVEVKLYSTADSARISVRDYGPGVPEDALPKIFPFFRVDDARESSTGGVGLARRSRAAPSACITAGCGRRTRCRA
jgi:signal transduction histidine kinase